MLDLKLIQKQPEILANALKRRHSSLNIEQFLELDKNRRTILAEVEALKAKRNKASEHVAAMKRAGEDAGQLIAELSLLSDKIQKLDQEAARAKDAAADWMLGVPNIPHESVPDGKDETENVEIRKWSAPRNFPFTPREHGELGIKLGGFDFERAAKLTGSRFVVEKGWAARLDRALINFFLDWHTRRADFMEISPPYLVNRTTMTGTGQLPKFEEDLFRIRDWDY